MRIWAIMISTSQEILRDKILFTILGCGIVAIFCVKLIVPLSVGEEQRIITDFGLSAISIFGILITIFIGTRLVYEEIKLKTIYTILSKPIRRWEFIMSKYLGIILSIVIVTAVLTGGFIVYLLIFKLPINRSIFLSILLELFELMIIASITLVFSTFTNPIGSGIFTFAFYFIGHFTRDILFFGYMTKIPVVKQLATVIYYIIPNLSYFNTRAEAVHNLPIFGEQLLFTISYGLCYMIIFVCVASLILEGRDL
ncbi:MAG TPA: ABC transporter permease [bacterium (Candidatus Stahlbacteria)]|nr:ABC transporter permease [Candidatus Stahlbacteria bacterium]